MARYSKPRPSRKAARAVNSARKAIRRISATTPSPTQRPAKERASDVDTRETENEKARKRRHEETRKQNSSAQGLPSAKRRRKTNHPTTASTTDDIERDKQDFFDAIDSSLYRVCGSCGELADADSSKLRKYDPTSVFFSPLCNDAGQCEVIEEGLVAMAGGDGGQTIWLCDRCYRYLLAGTKPKFCRSSGFRIGPVPDELLRLNRMETRLIGLGISFTTCVNLYKGGQEFTRGNVINYWNDPAKLVKELPRPLKECGIVFLASKSENTTNYYRVRPDLIRSALRWLIRNNPLYAHIEISEENLLALADVDRSNEIPTIPVTDEEENELRGQVNQVNENRSLGSVDTADNSENDEGNLPSGSVIHGECDLSRATNLPELTSGPDLLENITESFELDANSGNQQSEVQHMLSSIGIKSAVTQIPIGELNRPKDTLDEYNTKQMMQCCFPTLFLDGLGGFNPLDDDESRIHDYNLADYCAHLMKWHDRRYIIHGNFKFFCMNLIQRRQIDGLVRRINCSESRSGSIEDAGCGKCQIREDGRDESRNEGEELRAAMKVLDSLKPYFRVVRGSGLYWSNCRDALMAMIGNRVLPTRWPTFFLTLSAADAIWPDFARACNPSLTLDECRHLSFAERRKYLNENPDISARHFNKRFHAFF